MSIARRFSPRRFSPWGHISQAPLDAVQRALIAIFKQWGQPKAIKVDNGHPFGDPGSDLRPVLALWLMALGITVIWNRPRQPTDNAKVERMQAVTAAWAEPASCANVDELQQHLDEATSIQRSRYRCRRLDNQTRVEHYPALLSGGSSYDEQAFDLSQIFTFLAKGKWVRKVSTVGQIDFYHMRYSVGASYRRQHVTIHLDVQQKQWVVSADDDVEIKRFSAEFLCEQNIRGLSLCQ
jgi:hypothetical protein